MGQAPPSLASRLPITRKSGTAVLESYIGTGGMAHVFQARLENLPALIAELILAGESDPAVFGLDIPFRYGQGHLATEEHVAAIRDRATRLWDEYRQSPARGELQQKYLRVIDGRLLKNTVADTSAIKLHTTPSGMFQAVNRTRGRARRSAAAPKCSIPQYMNR